MAREIRVANSISGVGGPVVAPAATVPPGPHLVDGIWITFWTGMDTGDIRPSLVDVAAALGAFHTIGTAAVQESLPMLSPVFERIPARLAMLKTQAAVDAQTLRHLHAEFDAVCKGLDGSGSSLVVLHGDAHAGNLMHDGARWLWIDLEETCLGPPEWDLTVMFLSNRLGGAAALRQYAELRGGSVPTEEELAPFIRARRLTSAVWAMCMMIQHPGPFDEIATRRLAAVLGDR
jgi:aminoglycoside phosphotransferase (APT) family kinase protein